MNSLLVIWSLADPVTTSNVAQDTKFWGLWITCISLIGLVFLLATVLIMLIYNSDKLFSALVPVKRNPVQVNQDVHELLGESA
jgi:hypothetical protein